jgi:hypothetical protein
MAFDFLANQLLAQTATAGLGLFIIHSLATVSL